MSKQTTPGELTVEIRIINPYDEISPSGEQIHYYRRVGETWCKWVNAHGTESIQAEQLGLNELATLTLRHCPGLRPDSVIERAETGAWYDVISVDNVRERGFWTEIKVKRRVPAV